MPRVAAALDISQVSDVIKEMEPILLSDLYMLGML